MRVASNDPVRSDGSNLKPLGKVSRDLGSCSLKDLVGDLMKSNRQRYFDVEASLQRLHNKPIESLSDSDHQNLKLLGDEVVELMQIHEELKAHQVCAITLEQSRMRSNDAIRTCKRNNEYHYSIVIHLGEDWRRLHRYMRSNGSLSVNFIMSEIENLYSMSQSINSLDLDMLDKSIHLFDSSYNSLVNESHECKNPVKCRETLEGFKSVKINLVNGINSSHQALVVRRGVQSEELARRSSVIERYVK